MNHLRLSCVTLIVLGWLAVQLSGCALLIAGAASGGAAGTAASVKEGGESDHAPMTYAGTVVANVVYFPAKVLFAAGGTVASGVSYVVTLGRPQPTTSIWNAAVKGDYVMTPKMIEGNAPVHFTGA